MITKETSLVVADNTGAQLAQCIAVYGRKKYAKIGDIILVTIKKATQQSKAKKGTMHKAVIARTRKTVLRPCGNHVKFNDNAVVLLHNDRQKPLGTRVIGPVGVELRQNSMKTISIAQEVI